MRSNLLVFFLCAFSSSLSFSQSGNKAQAPTYDAGDLMRQNELNSRNNQLQQAAQRRHLLPPPLVMNDATSIQVQRIDFNGNRRLSTERLQELTLPYLRRPLSQHDLEQLTHAVTEAYRQEGWLVQAYIPKQPLGSDALVLQLIESIPPTKSPR